ncbi:MAG: hypothetical protein IPP33_18875 [Flavobacteriales bacterium]|nr:hypothetical protein [Flavobacteriales bacterium]
MIGSTLIKPEDNGVMYFVLNSTPALVSRFASTIEIGVADVNAKTMVVSCKDHSPFLARDLAQAMADEFIEYDVERKSESAKKVLKFIEDQKAIVFDELSQSEVKLQEFNMDNRISNMEDLMPMLLKRTDEYESQIVQLEIEDNLLDRIEVGAKKNPEGIDV